MFPVRWLEDSRDMFQSGSADVPGFSKDFPSLIFQGFQALVVFYGIVIVIE